MSRTRLPSSRRLAAAIAAALLAALAASPASAQRSTSTAPPPEGWSRRDRWQLSLHDGSYLWELGLVGVRGDTLLARQGDSLVLVPLERIDELRLVQASVRRTGEPGTQATFKGLAGGDDEVYALVRYAPAERRRIVEQALAAHPPAADSARPKTARP